MSMTVKRLFLKGCIPSPELAEVVLNEGDEVWTLNRQPLPLEKPPTRHFSLHGLRHELECHGRKYLLWLSTQAPTLYLWQEQIDLWDQVAEESGGPLDRPSDVRAFPLDDLKRTFPEHHYYTGSFAYMLAYALALNTFDEVHMLGVEFSAKEFWASRNKAADYLEAFLSDETPREGDVRKAINDLRGQLSGDESWARECIMYWAGRLEQAGTRFVTYPSSELFHNKWLARCTAESASPRCGYYGYCECIGG